jgi:hypothetical protein
MGIASGLTAVIAMIAVWVVLFLVFRFIVLWYWRVNEGIALLRSIDEKLGRMARGTATKVEDGPSMYPHDRPGS